MISNDRDITFIERLDKYFYKIKFDRIPEFIDSDNGAYGACTSFVRNGKLYRNLDWYYDDTPTFWVKCNNFEGMSFITDVKDGNTGNERIKQLPYHILDGRNNSGIMVSTHVLYNDWGYDGCGSKNFPIYKLPFTILSEINELISAEDLREKLSIYLDNLKISQTLVNAEYLLQFVITNGEDMYILSPPTNGTGSYEIIKADNDVKKLANFRYLPKKNIQRNDADIQLRPTGVERWNMVENTDLEGLKFTNAYKNGNLLSEFIGIRHTTKDSSDSDLLSIYETAREYYINRTRDVIATWQTVYSIVYSPEKVEELYVQEDYTKNYATDIFETYKMWLHNDLVERKEVEKSITASTVIEELKQSPAYQPSAKINGKPQGIIATRVNAQKCKITVLPDTNISVGDLVSVYNEKWICMSLYIDEYGLTYGEIWLSNYTMNFQNGNSTIITKYAILDDGSYQKVKEQSIKLPTNTYDCYVALDSDTSKLFIDKRLAIDTIFDRNGNEILEVVKISGIDRKTVNLGNGSHLLKMRVDSDVFNGEKDNVSKKICDYIEDTPCQQTQEENEECETQTALGEIVISGRDTIRVGTSRKYTAKCISNDGNSIELSNAMWQLENPIDGVEISLEEDGSCILSIPLNENLIGEIIRLICEDMSNNYQSGIKEIEVISIG